MNARLRNLPHKHQHYELRFGITEQDYRQMVIAQDGKCAICETEDSNLCVDHCHSTGVVRGLLCRRCNGFLGYLEKRDGLLNKIAEYINRPRPVRTLFQNLLLLGRIR